MANKIEVRVCVGSSCHIRGGDRTLRVLESLVRREKLTSRVSLRADLCLDRCLQAPNVAVDGVIHGGVTPERAEEWFNEHVLRLVNQ